MKGMTVSVLRNADGVDTSWDGISHRYATVLLVGEGVPEIFEATENMPVVKVVRRWAGTPQEYVHAEPIAQWRKAGIGPMFGGAFIHSSDSRFKDLNRYPIPLHDRWEPARSVPAAVLAEPVDEPELDDEIDEEELSGMELETQVDVLLKHADREKKPS